jgi:hypothetical protein
MKEHSCCGAVGEWTRRGPAAVRARPRSFSFFFLFNLSPLLQFEQAVSGGRLKRKRKRKEKEQEQEQE